MVKDLILEQPVIKYLDKLQYEFPRDNLALILLSYPQKQLACYIYVEENGTKSV